MKNFESNIYRDKLAKELRDNPKKKRKEISEQAKKTEKYRKAKEEHLGKRKLEVGRSEPEREKELSLEVTERMIEKLEDMNFDRRAIEVFYTLLDLCWAIAGEELVQKGEINHSPYDIQSRWIESYRRIRGGVTVKQWEGLKRIEAETIKNNEENNNWVIDSDHHLNLFNNLIRLSLEDESWARNSENFQKNYSFRRKKMEKLFDKCQFWSELNQAYQILHPLLSKNRLFYKEEE